MSRDQLVRVEPWVVLAAIRYGLPRVSYAHGESLDLIAQHAHLLTQHGWATRILDDLRLWCEQREHRHTDPAHHHAWQALADAARAVQLADAVAPVPKEATDG